jgi:hypothetical protein
VSQQPLCTNPWCSQIRKLPLTLAFFFVAVLTALFHAVFFLATRDWSLSLPFQLRALHDPLRDYSPPILPLCIQYIQPTCQDCSLHVPRRLWKVAESNRLLITIVSFLAWWLTHRHPD